MVLNTGMRFQNSDGYHSDRVVNKTLEQEQADSGRVFNSAYHELDVVDDGTINIHVLTNGNTIGLAYIAYVAGESIGKLIEAPTVSDNGTEITPISLNRQESKSFEFQIFHSASFSGGTVIAEQVIPGGIGPLARGAQTLLSKWRPKLNTHYIIQLQNVSGNAKSLGLTTQIELKEAI